MQSAGSYKKYSGAVEENAQYYVDWMHDNQKYMSTMQTWTPSVLITVLPVGLLLWSHGSLSASDFFTIIVLSMGFAGPFLAALSFVDELAIVKEINGILDSPELNRPEGKTSLSDEKVCLNQVSFSYGNQDEKVLKGVNLTINPGTVTALVGPSGSGKSTIAKLIAGFWDVTEGNITLGGKDIKEIPLDQLNQEIAYEILTQAGLSVEVAGDGTVAVEKMAASKPGQYDLIMMDIQMPIMNGYEATAAIRALPGKRGKVPIIAMTANAFAEDVQLAKNTGMNEHIAKPLDMTKLNAVLKQWL